MIFLANNEIKILPPEFFKLTNLTVISLRVHPYSPFVVLCLFMFCDTGNNSLEYLPPEIALLQALKDLDVVNNNLRFLPAEMATMTLTNLNVHTNPWYPDPAHTTSLPHDAPDGTTRVHFRVPPLREVVLRYLLTPSANQQRLVMPTATAVTTTATTCDRQSTTLEESFQLPLQEGALTPSDAALLARLAPAAVSAPRRHAFSRATTSGPGTALFSASSTTLTTKSTRRGDAEGDTANATMREETQRPHEQKSSGRCPSPRHCGTAAAAAQVAGPGPSWPWARLGPPFVLPAEERYTWVSELAGVRVGETTGGVPLLWRGCGPGCLNFLVDEGSKVVDAPAGVGQTEE